MAAPSRRICLAARQHLQNSSARITQHVSSSSRTVACEANLLVADALVAVTFRVLKNKSSRDPGAAQAAEGRCLNALRNSGEVRAGDQIPRA